MQRVVKGSAHLFSGNVAAAALAFLQGILIWRTVGDAGAGQVGVVTVFTSSINTLLAFRMSETVVRFAAGHLAAGRKTEAAAIIKMAGAIEAAASIAAYLTLILLAPWGARTFSDTPALASLMGIYGLMLLGNLVFETSTGVMRMTRRFDWLARITFAQSVVTFGLIAGAYLTGQGVEAILLAYLAGKLFGGFTLTFLASREADRQLGRGWWRVPLPAAASRREIFSFSLNTNLNGTLNLFTRDMTPLYLGAFRPDAEVGYFRLGQSLLNLVMMPIEPFIWPTYTEITHTIAARQWQATRRLLQQVSAIAAAWTLPAGLGLALLGPWLIPLLYKPQAAPAYPAALILWLGYGFATVFQWNRPLLLALGKPSIPVQIALGTGIVELALTFWLTPRYGYLAQATLLSGYFIASIGILVALGLRELKRQSLIFPPSSPPAAADPQ